MKSNQQPFVPNKKLILHFDVDGVLRLPTNKNKDFYVILHLLRFMNCVLVGYGASSKKQAKKTRIK